jgi:UDP:flavonoid glycosyltransferase YjiC (YdhE family)
MPYVWDGHDNATRVEETGHGFKLDRYNWTDKVVAERITRMLTDRKMKAKLKKASKDMRGRKGPAKAARVIDGLMRRKKAA